MIEDGARHFHDFDGTTYLNCANHGALPRVTADAVREAIALKTHPNRVPDHIYFTLTGRARKAIAPLIGAAPESITLGTGASHGAGVAALGFPWNPGDEVVIARSDFPANVYIWCNAARRAGATARVVKPARRAATTEEILAAIGPNTRVVAVSLVDFGTGEVIDVERVAEVCRPRGIFLAVDATQAAGIVPLDMKSLGASMLTVAAYKWMLAPYGSGYAAFAPEWAERIDPTYVTWTAARGAEKFNTLPREDWEWHETNRRFDAPEVASFLNVTGLARSAEFIAEIGLEAMHEHVTGLLGHLERNLPRPFRRRATPSRIQGPILSIEADDAERVHRAYERITEAEIVVSLREDGIRVSPHIYNTAGDIDRLLRLLGDAA
jgi:selenocysteine lyase/cysteine desulfurase